MPEDINLTAFYSNDFIQYTKDIENLMSIILKNSVRR